MTGRRNTRNFIKQRREIRKAVFEANHELCIQAFNGDTTPRYWKGPAQQQLIQIMRTTVGYNKSTSDFDIFFQNYRLFKAEQQNKKQLLLFSSPAATS